MLASGRFIMFYVEINWGHLVGCSREVGCFSEGLLVELLYMWVYKKTVICTLKTLFLNYFYPYSE